MNYSHWTNPFFIAAVFLFLLLVVAFVSKPDDEPTAAPANWCEGITRNNPHIVIAECSCNKDGSECYIKAAKKR